jgi:acetyl-CoA carboxylase/biotin carboxylase 1
VYVQAATEFADLHDKTGRMKAKEVIRDAVPWDSSREYFYYRAKRRMLEDSFVKRLQEASKGSLSRKVAMEVLSSLYTCDCTDNASVIEFLSNDASLVDAKIKNIRDETLEAQLASIKAEIAQG